VYAWDTLEWDHPQLGELRYAGGVQDALTATNVAGDWSNNPANDVGVDWVLSFPDKYAYLDYISPDACDGSSGSGKAWCLLYQPYLQRSDASGVNYIPYFPGVWTDEPAYTASPPTAIGTTLDPCLGTSNVTAWDTEEVESSPSVSVSPGSYTTLKICNELNVFTLAAATTTNIKPSVIQDNGDTDISRQVVTFENLDRVIGWGKLGLSWQNPDLSIGPNIYGDAVAGLIFTTRATSGPADQNGSLTDLQKNVGVTVPPAPVNVE
jgi:hypothetical protein